MRFRPKNPHTSATRRRRAQEGEPPPNLEEPRASPAAGATASPKAAPDEARRTASSALRAFELGADVAATDLRTEDEHLLDDVYEYLFMASFDTSAVDARARDGVVTLTGTVSAHDRLKRLKQLVLGIPGVVAVDLQVRVKARRPLRPLDEEPRPARPSWPGPVVALSPPSRGR